MVLCTYLSKRGDFYCSVMLTVSRARVAIRIRVRFSDMVRIAFSNVE